MLKPIIGFNLTVTKRDFFHSLFNRTEEKNRDSHVRKFLTRARRDRQKRHTALNQRARGEIGIKLNDKENHMPNLQLP